MAVAVLGATKNKFSFSFHGSAKSNFNADASAQRRYLGMPLVCSIIFYALSLQ